MSNPDLTLVRPLIKLFGNLLNTNLPHDLLCTRGSRHVNTAEGGTLLQQTRDEGTCAWRVLPHRTWTEVSRPTCQPLHCQPWSLYEGPRSSGFYSCLQPSCWFLGLQHTDRIPSWRAASEKDKNLRHLISTQLKSNEILMLQKSVTQTFQRRVVTPLGSGQR